MVPGDGLPPNGSLHHARDVDVAACLHEDLAGAGDPGAGHCREREEEELGTRDWLDVWWTRKRENWRLEGGRLGIWRSIRRFVGS